MKRITDLTIAVLSLPITVPLILLGMAVVRLTSPGPAIFRQSRVGLHGKPFTCYKLRTMHVATRDAPSHEVAASAVTPVGKWLRRLKLDELPQIWNIMAGDMSFVGPRPCLPVQTELIAARMERGLYDIRPGITGVSQVAGIDMSDPEYLAQSDARYLENVSFMTDLRLIIETALGAGRGDRVR